MELLANNYKKGDAFPARKNTNVLRVYNFQFCPFAERALLVLNAKGIEHEVINVNLRDTRPEWLVEKNPLGKVPVIEFDSDNKILYESLIVADYLDEAFESKRQLQSKDPYVRAKDRVFVELFSQLLSANTKVLYSNDDKSVLWQNFKPELKKIEDLFAKRRTKKFLFGDAAPGLTDYVIWPFIERLAISIALISDTDPEEYLKKELPTISDYRKQLLADSVVAKVSPKYENLLKFSKQMKEKLAQKQN